MQAIQMSKTQVQNILEWIGTRLLEINASTKNIFKKYEEFARGFGISQQKYSADLKDTTLPEIDKNFEKPVRKQLQPIRMSEVAAPPKEPPSVTVSENVATAQLEKRAPVIQGPLRSPSAISERVRYSFPGLKMIYQKYLRKGKHFEGTMIVQFKILPPGDIADAEIISSTMDHTAFEHDVLERIKMIQFKRVPDTYGPLTIKYPFEFKSLD
jgi:TonB family protein